MVLVFWLSIALIAYVYVGYPALLYCTVRVARRRTVKSEPASGSAVTSPLLELSLIHI